MVLEKCLNSEIDLVEIKLLIYSEMKLFSSKLQIFLNNQVKTTKNKLCIRKIS